MIEGYETQKNILKKVVQRIDKPEAILRFFALLNELIDSLNLPKTSPNIAFTVNNKESRISIFVNNFTVLQIVKQRNDILFGLLFKKEFEQNNSLKISTIKFEPKSADSYCLGWVSFENTAHLLKNEHILRYWVDCAQEIKESAMASNQKNKHNSAIYEAAEDAAFRAELMQQDTGYSGDFQTTNVVQETAVKYLVKPNIPLNYILYGPPGTGKTHRVQALCGNVEHRFVTFHQSYSYEEFIEGIRPETLGDKLRYQVRQGVFYEAALAALRLAGYSDFESCKNDNITTRQQRFANAAPYIIVIDELNRANIAAVLGELITLLEDSKRLGKADELWLTLPYSQRIFGVPANLYVLGTMNSSDRSVALLDTALRRRFKFEECMPDPLLLTNKIIEDTHLDKLLRTINDRITYFYDRDHTIGHTYFLTISTFDDLCEVFQTQIIPLLQEYFYTDWQKITWILGDNTAWGKDFEAKLVQVTHAYTPARERELFGEDFDTNEPIITYQINPLLTQKRYAELPKEMFKKIYEKP
jgi:5-methylcytosine-specific restriction enzyme B